MPFLSKGRGDSKVLENRALNADARLVGSSLSSGFSFLAWPALVPLIVGSLQVDLRFPHF